MVLNKIKQKLNLEYLLFRKMIKIRCCVPLYVYFCARLHHACRKAKLIKV